MFFFFLKVGAVLFGSGYVLLAFLRADLVERWHWLTESQLLDAIAVGQFTPGPVFTTATFIGYLLSGPTGGVVATVGIFLPAFIFVALSSPTDSQTARLATRRRVSRRRQRRLARPDGGRHLAARADGAGGLAHDCAGSCGAAALLIRWRINSAWLVLGGAGCRIDQRRCCNSAGAR
jgi:chromate transporter